MYEYLHQTAPINTCSALCYSNHMCHQIPFSHLSWLEKLKPADALWQSLSLEKLQRKESQKPNGLQVLFYYRVISTCSNWSTANQFFSKQLKRLKLVDLSENGLENISRNNFTHVKSLSSSTRFNGWYGIAIFFITNAH